MLNPEHFTIIAGEDVVEQLTAGGALEGRMSGQERIQGRAERIDVRRRSDGLATRLLGRHEGDGSDQLTVDR